MKSEHIVGGTREYRFSEDSAAPEITEMTINFEKTECLKRTDKENEKEGYRPL